MLKQITKDVLVHESECIQSNAVIIQGNAGVLIVDAGLTSGEMVTIADDLHELGQSVIAGFSTHPHWDHVLWHAGFSDVPRYGTARAAAEIKTVLSNPNWRANVAEQLPPEVAEDIPLDDLFGQITGLDSGTTQIPWDGPRVRIIEHNAHATGHAALLIEKHRVLVAGDMLSDVLVPMLNFGAANPIQDYLTALQQLEEVADDVDVIIPGHGSTGKDIRARIELDRMYIQAIRDGTTPDDPRVASPKPGWEWVADVHAGQMQILADRSI